MPRRRAPGSTWLLALALFACPPAILAQTALAPADADPVAVAVADREGQLLDTISQEEARNGAHSQSLIEPLTALALLYQDRDNAIAAIATIQQLLQVIRANEGLHSLDQVEPIRQLIGTVAALGDAATAWSLEQDLLTLARRHPDDLRTVAIFRDSAEKKSAALNRFIGGENTPEVELGCYRGWRQSSTASCVSGGRDDAIRAMVSDVQRDYADAIAVILRNERFSSAELRELETQLLRSIDAARQAGPDTVDTIPKEQRDSEPWRSSLQAVDTLATWPLPVPPETVPLEPGAPRRTATFDYLHGRESLERQLKYEAASSASRQAQIDAFVRIADWDLQHSQNALALNEYEQAYRLLERGGERAVIDAVFTPPIPVMLPSYLPNPLSTVPTDAARGYIDVRFDITKLSVSRQAEIVDATPNASKADKDRVLRLIGDNRFRPRATADGWGSTASVTLRYYLGE